MRLKNKINAAPQSPSKRTKKRPSRPQNTQKAPKKPHKKLKPLKRPPNEVLNMPEPMTMSPQQVRKLTKDWYKKLADTGFQDLEHFNAAGEAGPLLKGNSLRSIAQNYSPSKQHYYACLTNFLTHVPDWTKDPLDLLIGTLLAEGLPYRDIIKAAKKEGHTKRVSIFSIHHVAKIFEKRALYWNKRHPEGLDFEPSVGKKR